MRVRFFFVISILLVFSHTALAQGSKPTRGEKMLWSKALSIFTKNYRSKDASQRALAGAALGEGLCPGQHYKAARLLFALLTEEIARGKKKEENIRYGVIEGVVFSLRRIHESKALNWLLGKVHDPRLPWRLRFHIIDGFGAHESPAVIKALVDAAGAADARLRIGAIDRLGSLQSADGIDVLLENLRDSAWQVRLASVHALARVQAKNKVVRNRVIDGFIKALEKTAGEGGRLQFEIVNVLKKISGRSLGFEAGPWRAWNKRRLSGKPTKGGGISLPVVPTYHGLRIWSNRVVFVIDVTGSMADPASKEAKEKAKRKPTKPLPREVTGGGENPRARKFRGKLNKLKEENDQRRVWNKMDAEKKELINAVLHLRPATHFTIIFWAEVARAWKSSLVPATPENKIDAIEEIEKVGPLGGTDLLNAVVASFKIYGLGEEGGKSGTGGRTTKVTAGRRHPLEDLTGKADEIFLLTDGVPTVGEITDPDRICEEIRKINRLRKIRINAIAVGVVGKGVSPVDLGFMKKIAEQNGGKFVHVK